MGPADAIKSCFRNYATFSGRASRAEYWWFSLFAFVVYIVLFFLGKIGLVLAIIAVLALIVPGLAVAVRRLHDTGRSGWWWFIGLVPFVGGIILLVFMVLPSQGPNSYGTAAPSSAPAAA